MCAFLRFYCYLCKATEEFSIFSYVATLTLVKYLKWQNSGWHLVSQILRSQVSL